MSADIVRELNEARKGAIGFNVYEFPNPIRSLVTRVTSQTYKGSRSVENYLNLMDALISDETGIFKANNVDMRMLFINSLKSRDTHLESMLELTNNGKQVDGIDSFKQNLVNMIRGAADRNILSNADLIINFSSRLLEDAKIIPSKIIFDRKLVRLNTSILYKQNKFNLMRENNEGYAALVNDFIFDSIDIRNNEHGQALQTPLDRIPQLLRTIITHIGIFHLDPNRVLDIILDFYVKELDRNYNFWISLLKQSPWIQELVLGNNAEGGSAVIAHLMGFRFIRLQTDEVRNAPKELYYACALLIKHGLMELCDIIPYLRPSDEDMVKKKSEYMEHMRTEIKSNTGGLLAMFGALGEDGMTERMERPKANLTKEDESNDRTYTANDVVELTRALISIGDVRHAGLMFVEYDKLIDMYPKLAHNIYRLCDVMLDDVYEKYVPEDIRENYKNFERRARNSEIKSVFGSIREIPKMAEILVLDNLKDETHDLKKNERYLFFYRDWKRDLPKVENFKDLVNVYLPVMRMAGYKTYLASNLIAKLMLIIRSILERDRELEGSRPYCMAIIREVLLPAVSFSNCNPGTMGSLWELLELLSFQERYALYGEWSDSFYKKTKECELLKQRTERAVKSVMQRVSKNDVRQCGRDLGKLANSNPTIVFNFMLDQIQTFDNMAPYMADACRYMSDFTFDILGYLMTEKWTGYQKGKIRKPKMKDDMIPSAWLRALSVFSGMLYKKQGIEPTPLLRYMIVRLHYDDAVDDLILFNEFITKTCGIEIMGSAMTDDQITSASCSESVRAEAFQSILPDNRRASKRVVARLKEALRTDDTALQLIVLLYRLREACLRENMVTTGTLGPRLDYVHQTINQCLEMLTSIFDPDEYAALIPDVSTLYSTYCLPEYLVMHLTRPKIQRALRTYEPEGSEKPNPDEPHPVFRSLIEEIPRIITDPCVLKHITSEFYVMFWQLSLYDILVPEAHYQAAMKKQSDIIAQCRDTRSTFYLTNRPSVVLKTERQAQAVLDSLKQDFPRHKADVQKTMEILSGSHSRWFPMDADRLPLISAIIQYCLLPRSVLSEVDAVFCYEFVMLMHRLGVHNFSSLTLFDKVLSESLPTALVSFTEYETTIHARFLYRTFAKMSEWHKDETLYVKEAQGNGLIGFQKKWNAQTSGQGVAKEDLLSFFEFKRVMHKWNLKTTLWIEQALQSGEPHQIRNAFLILKQFIPHFPVIRDHGQVAVRATEALAKREQKDNLRVLARSYLGLVEKSKARWITKNAFMGLEEPASAKEPANAPELKAESSRSDERVSSSERRRTREESSHASVTKRSRYDDEKNRDSKRDAGKDSVRESARERTREPARDASKGRSRSASVKESTRDSHTRETPSREQPRTRDHTRENPSESVRESTQGCTRESALDSSRLSSKGSTHESHPSSEKSRADRRSTAPGIHNDDSNTTLGYHPSASTSPRKRTRMEEEQEKEKGSKRHRQV
ncbi:transcription factor/nuclear export subunit protein 2-domain-containing protein [Dichotomocladium elegans]|nr:transcription factor/nuclear export subunit protein 2-domain-containing protein [Dichotomocladium elegans]